MTGAGSAPFEADPFGAPAGKPPAPTDVRVVSIGALDAHPLRGERSPVRTGHATTTLIATPERTILVDPGLPAEVLTPRLHERTGLEPSDVSHVFLTCFRPDVRRGLGGFPDAVWWISADEREAVGVPLAHQLRHAEEVGAPEMREALRSEVALLHRCEAAPDELAPGVSLFPMPGATPGMTGLLVALERHTLLVCGDAAPTIEHVERREAPRWSASVDQAKASFNDALEIADLLILGRDNLIVNPAREVF